MEGGFPPSLFLPLLAIMGLAFCLGPILLSKIWSSLVSQPRRGPTKLAPYECGIESTGDAWVRLHSGYYRYAIVFLVLDVESVLFLPIATVLGRLQAGPIFGAVIFVLLLVEGLIWAWKKGMLKWS